jgi:spermidine/putrescine transport system substrate-binding protein
MKTFLALLALALPLQAANELHLYTWADYIKPELVEKFEAANHCKVVIDTFDSNESMYAKVRAGASGYDILVPSSYMVKLMASQGLIMPLDRAKLKGLENIDAEVLAKVGDSKMEHAVPYATSYGVLAYRKDKLKDAQPTWAMLDRTDLGRKACILNDMRETLGAALKFLGHSLNTKDEKQLAAARDVVIGWKGHVAKFDNEQYKSAIDAGEFNLVHGYSGDLFQVVSENDKVGILMPKEGMTMACDELVIPKGAANPALAYAWVNFILDPAVAAENMEFMGYLMPNTAAVKKVSPDFLSNPAVAIPAELKAKCEVIDDVGDDLAKYTKVWDEVKAAK